MPKTQAQCPICGEGRLRTATFDLAIQHRNIRLPVRGLEHSECSACGETPILPDQIRKNDRIIADAKRSYDGFLTGKQIAALRKTCNLTQYEAARIFGGGKNAFSKYERGEVIQSESMDRLLRLVSLLPWLVYPLRWIAGETSNVVLTQEYSFSKHIRVANLEGEVAEATRVIAKRSSGILEDSEWRKTERDRDVA